MRPRAHCSLSVLTASAGPHTVDAVALPCYSPGAYPGGIAARSIVEGSRPSAAAGRNFVLCAAGVVQLPGALSGAGPRYTLSPTQETGTAERTISDRFPSEGPGRDMTKPTGAARATQRTARCRSDSIGWRRLQVHGLPLRV